MKLRFTFLMIALSCVPALVASAAGARSSDSYFRKGIIPLDENTAQAIRNTPLRGDILADGNRQQEFQNKTWAIRQKIAPLVDLTKVDELYFIYDSHFLGAAKFAKKYPQFPSRSLAQVRQISAEVYR